MTWGRRINIACVLVTGAAWAGTGFASSVGWWFLLVLLALAARVLYERALRRQETRGGTDG